METFEGKANVKTVNGQAPDSGGNVNVKEYSHPSSGVTAGTYRKVTVNAQGHVTKGENPTLAISEGGTGATTAKQARTNLGIDIDVSLSEATLLYEAPSYTTGANGSLANLNQPYTNFKKLLVIGKSFIDSRNYSCPSAAVIDVDVLSEIISIAKNNGAVYAQLAILANGNGIYLSLNEKDGTTTKAFYVSSYSGATLLRLYGYK